MTRQITSFQHHALRTTLLPYLAVCVMPSCVDTNNRLFICYSYVEVFVKYRCKANIVCCQPSKLFITRGFREELSDSRYSLSTTRHELDTIKPNMRQTSHCDGNRGTNSNSILTSYTIPQTKTQYRMGRKDLLQITGITIVMITSSSEETISVL